MTRRAEQLGGQRPVRRRVLDQRGSSPLLPDLSGAGSLPRRGHAAAAPAGPACSDAVGAPRHLATGPRPRRRSPGCAGLRIGLELAQDVRTVTLGHQDVEQDRRRLRGAAHRPRRARRTRRCDDAVAVARKHLLQQRRDGRVVVHAEQQRPARRRSPCPDTGIDVRGGRQSSGSLRWNVLPRPRLALERDVAAHRPREPAADRQAQAGAASGPSAWWNSSKIASC